MDKYVPVVFKRVVFFFSVLSLFSFKSAVVHYSNAVCGLRRATDSSNLLGTWVLAIMVFETKEHFQLKPFNFCRLDTVIFMTTIFKNYCCKVEPALYKFSMKSESANLKLTIKLTISNLNLTNIICIPLMGIRTCCPYSVRSLMNFHSY